MLSDKALEELRQERHDDYVAEARRDSAAQLNRAAALERRAKFIFLTCLLEAQQAMQVLNAERQRLQGGTKRNPLRFVPSSPLIDALWAGYYALHDEASRCADAVLDRGQLLFAFEGTTLLTEVGA